MSQVLKKQKDNQPEWFRLKKLWRKYNILRGKGDIIQAQLIARDIQSCQRDLRVPIANFDEVLSITLWE